MVGLRIPLSRRRFSSCFRLLSMRKAANSSSVISHGRICQSAQASRSALVQYKILPISRGLCQRSVMVRRPRCSFKSCTSQSGIQGAHKPIRCSTFWSAHAGARLATQTSWNRCARPSASLGNTPLGKCPRQRRMIDPHFKQRSFSVLCALLLPASAGLATGFIRLFVS